MTISFCSGFTLLEMTIVMAIMGLVMMTVLPALNTVRSANQLSLTQSNLRSLMLATAAYVQANGCLPCPALPGGTTTNFGRIPGGSACGICSAPEGIPPFVSLGISASTAHDGWEHWITMRVDSGLTSIPASLTSIFVPPAAPCTAVDVANGFCTSSQIGFSVKGFCKAGTPSNGSIASGVKVTTTGNGATQYPAVIFVSHGSTGYGSYTATPRQSGCLFPFASNYHACNPPNNGYAQCNSAVVDADCTRNNTAQFYDAPIAISDTDSYDDVLAYADRNTLVSMLGTGACATTW
jgi:prepilin-type N-terminal cleavage/methylation domain-containing protein